MAELSAQAPLPRTRGIGRAGKGLRHRPPKGEGQQATAAGLDLLRVLGWLVQHDVAVPGDAGVVDHLLVGPSGVYVVNTVNWSGAIKTTEHSLSVGGVDHTDALDDAATAAEAVRSVLHGVPVAPMLCFERLESVAGVAADVALCASENILDLLTSQAAILDQPRFAQASRMLAVMCRPDVRPDEVDGAASDQAVREPADVLPPTSPVLSQRALTEEAPAPELVVLDRVETPETAEDLARVATFARLIGSSLHDVDLDPEPADGVFTDASASYVAIHDAGAALWRELTDEPEAAVADDVAPVEHDDSVGEDVDLVAPEDVDADADLVASNALVLVRSEPVEVAVAQPEASEPEAWEPAVWPEVPQAEDGAEAEARLREAEEERELEAAARAAREARERKARQALERVQEEARRLAEQEADELAEREERRQSEAEAQLRAEREAAEREAAERVLAEAQAQAEAEAAAWFEAEAVLRTEQEVRERVALAEEARQRAASAVRTHVAEILEAGDTADDVAEGPSVDAAPTDEVDAQDAETDEQADAQTMESTDDDEVQAREDRVAAIREREAHRARERAEREADVSKERRRAADVQPVRPSSPPPAPMTTSLAAPAKPFATPSHRHARTAKTDSVEETGHHGLPTRALVNVALGALLIAMVIIGAPRLPDAVSWAHGLFAGPPAPRVGTAVTVDRTGSHPKVTVLAGRPVDAEATGDFRAGKGQHLVAVPLRLANEGLLRWDLRVAARTTVVDSVGAKHAVDKGVSGVEGLPSFPAQAKIVPGEVVTGYVVFSVPNGRAVSSVNLGLSRSGDDTVTWQVTP